MADGRPGTATGKTALPCSAEVHYGPGWTSPCGRAGKVLYEGRWYCGIHDPMKARLRRKASDARYEAKRNVNDRQKRVTDLTEEVVEAASRLVKGYGTLNELTEVIDAYTAAEEALEAARQVLQGAAKRAQ